MQDVIEKVYEGSEKKVALKDIAPGAVFSTRTRNGHRRLWVKSRSTDEEGNPECLLFDDPEEGREGAIDRFTPSTEVILPKSGKLLLKW